MGTFRKVATIETKGEGDVVDITGLVEETVAASGMDQGMVLVFTPHSTAAVVIMENEPGSRKDLGRSLERNFPTGSEYQHDLCWGTETCTRMCARRSWGHRSPGPLTADIWKEVSSNRWCRWNWTSGGVSASSSCSSWANDQYS